MDLQPHDLHVEFSRAHETLKVFGPKDTEIFMCEARNRTVNAGEGHWGHCPDGEFLLGAPEAKGTVPFGYDFIPVEDYAGHYSMRDFHREGIGIHGGGSGLPEPFAPHQGWVVTEGCIRLQNIELGHLVSLVKPAQKAGGKVYFTVQE